MRRSWISTSLVFVLGLGLACGGGGGGPVGPGGDDGSGTLGPAGGTVSLQTQAGVTVPAGALAADVTITVTPVAMPAALQAAGAIAQAYRFAPEGQQFQLPVEVFVFVPNSALTGIDPADLTLLATTATGFEELTGITVDIGASGITVRGHVTHFTVIAAAVEEDAPPPNRAPTASAGADQNATVGVQVTLQGGSSSDPDGDPLTFQWRAISSPGGVTVSITGGATAQPTFTPSTAGVYEFELTVSDGELAVRDTVRVTAAAANLAPVVDAGSDQSIILGGAATVTAVATDPNADPLTYAWTVQSRPAGSTAALSATNTPAVSITPDVAGEYVLQVTVSDGRGGQATDGVKVTATAPGMNRAPTADAGFNLEGTETIPVTLDGTNSSDPDGDPLTYTWTFVSVPAGSSAGIIAANAASASFTPDVEGVYVVQLQVSDGQLSSTDTATITAGPFNHTPVGTLTIAGGAQILAGASVTATAAFTDADDDPLDFTWTLDAPDGSVATLTVSGDETQATFTADVPGEFVIALSVTDGENVVVSQVTVTAYPLVGGTYNTNFTLTFISSICQGALGLVPGQSVVTDMLVSQLSPSTAQLGISALITNVQDDPVASLSPDGLAVYTGPIVLETGDPETPTIRASGNITLPFQFANGSGSPATGFHEGRFDFTAIVFLISCTVQGTLESPAN
ncbi:MAG TPA: PKD domain-containing protein [Gemmatimonadota bacterium]|nr:PKD domain-containing protein [Gemmatimonadota bacterium]